MSFRVVVLLGLVAIAACSTGEPARPTNTTHLRIGPSPLRRMSNDEYRNTLHDLFPKLTVEMPTLPRDLAVAGFENAAESQEPSDLRTSRYEEVAELYAAAVTSDPKLLNTLAGCDDWSTPELARICGRQFLQKTGRRIFRRPLTNEERERFGASFDRWVAEVDFEGAIRLTLATLLQSPQFLYRIESLPPGAVPDSIIPVDSYAMASRLSFFLWESTPDDDLLDAAAKNEIQTAEQIESFAEEMLKDARAKRVYWSFHRQWLGLDRILEDEHLVRTSDVDPGWGPLSRPAAAKETQLFVERTLGEGGSFADLWTSRRAWVNVEMARIYGVKGPASDDTWKETMLPEDERAGILTRTSFLAGFSHRGATSPPVRANSINLHLFCRTPVMPPAEADLSQPTAKAGEGPKTNRMLFEERTEPANCQFCHIGLNGLGFGLEHYNAAGRFQRSENGVGIDARGALYNTDVDGPFNGGIELSDAIARSVDVRNCATEQWVRFALGRAPTDVEVPTVNALAKRFGEDGGDIKRLMIDIATSPSFRLRHVEER